MKSLPCGSRNVCSLGGADDSAWSIGVRRNLAISSESLKNLTDSSPNQERDPNQGGTHDLQQEQARTRIDVGVRGTRGDADHHEEPERDANTVKANPEPCRGWFQGGSHC